jgi:tryptophan 2,3-dioxygenase
MERNVYYSEYLQLDRVLSAQTMLSQVGAKAKPAHDEHLFIVIHQTYELWFKQIIYEVNSLREIMATPFLSDYYLHRIVARLDRCKKILNVLVDQIEIMESMTTLDFLDFRDFLVPASGFQSLQFRLLETALGLKEEDRTPTEKLFFNSRLKEEDQRLLKAEQAKTSFFDHIEKWLERMPFTQTEEFDFWQTYQSAVKSMLERDEHTIENNKTLSPFQREMEFKTLEFTRENFQILFDKNLFNLSLKNKKRKLSHSATTAALFIFLYRDEPALNLPFRLLQGLIDMDEMITLWRYRHAMMVQRILGSKIGTGGSSGHEYLKKTTENSRFFADFFNLASFMIPRSEIPVLPQPLRNKLSFSYGQERGV